MLAWLYRASFFLYEAGFLVFAAALLFQALALRRLGQALHLGAWWLSPAVAAAVMAACAALHFIVYHVILPQYLLTAGGSYLHLMYWLKFATMASIFGAGVVLAAGQGILLRNTTR